MPKLKKQVLLYEPQVSKPSDFTDHTKFYINNDFGVIKNGKAQRRGKVNLIGKIFYHVTNM